MEPFRYPFVERQSRRKASGEHKLNPLPATKTTWNTRLTLLKAYQRAGTIVMVLNKTDFQKAASEGTNLIRVLLSVYEQVRFDIRA